MSPGNEAGQTARLFPDVRISMAAGAGLALTAIAAFHLSALRFCQFFILLFLLCLLRLARLNTARKSFYAGLMIGLGIYAPNLIFFWTIFQAGAMALWLVLAFWLGLFVALIHAVAARWGWRCALLVAPLLWTGLEYFRSELYYLRFSWLTPGLILGKSSSIGQLAIAGAYGLGFGGMLLAAAWSALPSRFGRLALVPLLVTLGIITNWTSQKYREPDERGVSVAGVQLEFPAPAEVRLALDQLIHEHPEAELLVLSEYTFDGPVPPLIKAWCQKHRRYLVAGGKEPAAGQGFYNTAFVVGPSGEVIFSQGKSVPIQFFDDGLPAPAQTLWHSPWGKLGLCVCYDLSYRRVVDGLVRAGAQGLIVPTMDPAGWGLKQHQLHARVAPLRAAEYRLPIFRLCSSGISQLIDRHGQVAVSGPFPGPGATLAGRMELPTRGRLPWDCHLAPAAAGFSFGIAAWLILAGPAKTWFRPRRPVLKKSASDPS